MLLTLLVFAASWFIGIWAFAQIIGTLQNLRAFGPIRSVGLLVLWVGILCLFYWLVSRFIPRGINGLYFGFIISLVMILFSGRIK